MEAILGPHIGYMAAMTMDTRKMGLTGRQKLRPSLLCHPKNRLIRAPDGEPGLNYLCAGLSREHYRYGGGHITVICRSFGASLLGWRA
jgi:hypothetical protein